MWDFLLILLTVGFQMENLNNVLQTEKGVGRCPYNPQANSTALLSASGQYYVASPIDFSGMDAALVRSSSLLGRRPSQLPGQIRSPTSESKWFNDPQFVGSFETDSHYYFVFRENAVEYLNCGKVGDGDSLRVAFTT